MLVIDDLDVAGKHLETVTRGRGVDHVADYVGHDALTSFAMEHLRPGGRYCVAAGEDAGQLPITPSQLIRLEASVLGVRGAKRIDAMRALDLLTQNRIYTPIVARFPLKQAGRAHRYLEDNSTKVGRVILVP